MKCKHRKLRKMLFVIVFGNLFASSCIKYYKITGKYWAEVMHEMIGNYGKRPKLLEIYWCSGNVSLVVHQNFQPADMGFIPVIHN